MQPDAVNSPRYYVGKSGREVIEITHLFMLGPDLTQAVNYIMRAGRKTPDPREDLRKAVYYLNYAAKLDGQLVFGLPQGVPSIEEIVADFDVDAWYAPALRMALWPLPVRTDCLEAARLLERAIEAYTSSRLPVPHTGAAA
jgi:hypothetical protein